MKTEGASQRKAVKKVKVFIADDHEMIRVGLRQFINSLPQFEVCGECSSSLDALHQIPKLTPQIALVDLQLPPTSGVEVIRSLSKSNRATFFLAVSANADDSMISRVLNAGAHGFFAKSQQLDHIKGALETIMNGKVYYGTNVPGVTKQAATPSIQEEDPRSFLSPREYEIFEMIGAGIRSNEIATRLTISAKTVNVHRFRMMGKMNLRHTQELSIKAYQWVHAKSPAQAEVLDSK
jgi:two-component system invasion response regulator UvrY